MREEDEDELKIRSETLVKQMHEKEKELSQCKAQVEDMENQIKVSDPFNDFCSSEFLYIVDFSFHSPLSRDFRYIR